jgi:hypothetical protein
MLGAVGPDDFGRAVARGGGYVSCPASGLLQFRKPVFLPWACLVFAPVVPQPCEQPGEPPDLRAVGNDDPVFPVKSSAEVIRLVLVTRAVSSSATTNLAWQFRWPRT